MVLARVQYNKMTDDLLPTSNDFSSSQNSAQSCRELLKPSCYLAHRAAYLSSSRACANPCHVSRYNTFFPRQEP